MFLYLFYLSVKCTVLWNFLIIETCVSSIKTCIFFNAAKLQNLRLTSKLFEFKACFFVPSYATGQTVDYYLFSSAAFVAVFFPAMS